MNETMKIDTFEKLKVVEGHAQVGSPLMQLFNER
jgi:hypothetical protein